MLRIWANVLEDRGRLFRDGKEAEKGEAQEETAKNRKR
jgi:hypothetical protein